MQFIAHSLVSDDTFCSQFLLLYACYCKYHHGGADAKGLTSDLAPDSELKMGWLNANLAATRV